MKNDIILSVIEHREKAMGRFIARFASMLPEDIRAAAFCSPASFRDPETDNSWHPYMICSGYIPLLLDQIPLLSRAFVSGIRRFLLASFGRFYYIPKDSNVLGIAPVNICKPLGDAVDTSYCNYEEKDKIAWLLVDETKKEHQDYAISRVAIVLIFFQLLFCWIRVSFAYGKTDRFMDWITAAMLTMRWIISFRWVHMLVWAKKIREILDSMKPEKVYCLHEMHPHSRIAWIEAGKRNIPTVTVQHASIARAKLWYFPTDEEILAGMATPDEFVVFSYEEEKQLRPFYPQKTHFRLNCGPRFSKWKTAGKLKSIDIKGNLAVLFAGSIPWWDNEVILKGVQRLLETSRQNRKIIVRLHPTAKISKSWAKWLNRMVKDGTLTISNRSLIEDITCASIVIGMNSTVLEECALMGLASIRMKSDRYLSFSAVTGEHVSVDCLSWEIVENVVISTNELKEEYIQQARRSLGIDIPVFSIFNNFNANV